MIDRYPHWDYRRVKEVTRTRLHHNNINRDKGIEIPEAWMPIRSDNTAVDRYFSGPLREHFPPLTMPIIIWIETRQPSARFVLYESLTTKVVVNRHYRLMKTCNARFKRRDQYLSGNRETNDKQYTLNIRSRGKQLVLFSQES